MARQHILVVDDDQKSLQVLEISLKKAGYLITTAANGLDGLEKAKTSVPELIISDVKMPKMNGYQFCKRIKEDPNLRHIPFIFLSSQRSVDDKIKGLELGVDDYLTKPIYIRELLTRVRLLMQKKEKESIERVGVQTEFAGKLSDMGVVDLLQTLEIGRKTGVLYVTSGEDLSGLIYFKDGQVIDAIQGSRKGPGAIYRMLIWSDGAFKIDFKPINRQPTIQESTQGVIMEGMRRLDEWERLAEQLPPLDTVLVIDPHELLTQYPDKFPDKAGKILQLFDGKRAILEVVDRCGLDDLPALDVISRLYFQGLLKELDRGAPPLVQTQAPPPPPAPPAASAPAPPAPLPPQRAPEAPGGEGGEVMDVRALLARSGIRPTPALGEPTPTPAASPGNGSPEEGSIFDLGPSAPPPPLPPPPAPPQKAPARAKKEKKKEKKEKRAKVLAPAEARLVGPSIWQRRPLLLGLFAGAGLMAFALLAAAWFGTLERLGMRPMGDLFGGGPSLERLESQAASYAPEPLEELLTEISQLEGPGQREPDVASLKARTLLRLGELDRSLPARLRQADQVLRTVSSQAQDEPVMQLAWAEYEVARGEFDNARARAGRLAGNADPQIAARAAYVSGLADLREGDKGTYSRAIESLDAASKVLTDDAGVRIALAQALLEVSNYNDARKRTEQAIALSPQAGRAYKLRARACEALGERPCAAESWQQAVLLAPGDPDAALGRASYIWQQKKDAAEAKAQLERIVQNPDWSAESGVLARAYFLLGEIEEGRGNKQQALAAYEKVRALDSTYPALAARLSQLRPKPKPKPAADPRQAGRKALRQGRFRAAIPLLEAATAQHPRDDTLFADLGMTYLQIDQSLGARRAFEKALTINSNNVTALRWLGQIYTTLGRKEVAAKMFHRFLRLAPNHPDAPLVRALLRRINP